MTSEAIKKTLVDRLYWDGRVDASDVRVGVDNGIVRLSGRVPDYVAFNAAEEDAGRLPGVRLVDNQLSVRYPPHRRIPTDEEIEHAVRTVLSYHPSFERCDLNIAVERGRVVLDGTVDAYWKKAHVQKVVSQIAGVLAVTNRLAVIPSDHLADEIIARAITDTLEQEHIDLDDVSTEVNNGRVTISGAVPSCSVHRRIIDTIRHTVGVVSLIDNLVIEPQP